MKTKTVVFLYVLILGLLTACQQKGIDKKQNVSADTNTMEALLGEHLQYSEGMWMPNQLPAITNILSGAGLELDPKALTQLTEFPMNAIVSLGGCSASFVSAQGLVVTNHHCAYGNIQYNSKEGRNLIQDGFLAKSFSEELPAAPGSRIFVTESVKEVTDVVNSSVPAGATGFGYFQAKDKARKRLVSECEKDFGYRCQVYSFYGGLQYYLIKQLEIKDVRLVHAPQDAVGRYGGDIDNWMWPRHTGDYSFYRAYVSKEGKATEYAEDNVPYKPKSWLKIANKGVEENDYVMVIGYPGVTNRYRLAEEVKHGFTWYYPFVQKYLSDSISLMETAASDDKDAQIKYASQLAAYRNYEKNFGVMIEGYQNGTLLEKKLRLESDLTAWMAADPKREQQYRESFKALKQLIIEENKVAERDFYLDNLGRLGLLTTAMRLYRHSKEQQKPDAERESGYQDRDKPFNIAGLKRLDRRFDTKVDKALTVYAVESYLNVPKSDRVTALDDFLELDKGIVEVKKKLDWMYKNTGLTDQAKRLAWLEKPAEAFEKSDDPFIQLAVALYDYTIEKERVEKARQGEYSRLRPQFMAMLTDFYQQQGRSFYPDANGTLRVTYGTVKGYKPRDGKLSKTKDGTNGKDRFVPFTTLEGITEKYSTEEPFKAPKKQMDLIKAKKYEEFLSSTLGSVPVNYLSTVDITGGNSGSPTLNAKGEFVGLVFDGTYESINSDWDFSNNSRSIHVDSRYMLWTMKYVDGADNLLKEMEYGEK